MQENRKAAFAELITGRWFESGAALNDVASKLGAEDLLTPSEVEDVKKEERVLLKVTVCAYLTYK